MKYIKLFEVRRKRTGPQKGDFVVLKFKDEETDEDLIEFFSKNIGKITMNLVAAGYYLVEYKNMPDELQRINGYPLVADDENIVFYAKTKREVQDYLVAVKYNL